MRRKEGGDKKIKWRGGGGGEDWEVPPPPPPLTHAITVPTLIAVSLASFKLFTKLVATKRGSFVPYHNFGDRV